MTTAPVVIVPAAGAAVVWVAHEGVPPTVGNAEVAAAGDDAPAPPLAAVPAVAPLADPPVHGWATGAATGVGVGVEVTGADVGGGFGAVGVAPGAGAPAVVVGVVGDPVVAGGGTGVEVAAVVVVATDEGAADVVSEPVEVWPTAVTAAAIVAVAPDPAAALVPVAAPTAAVADAATHRLASSTDRALTVTAVR